MRFSEAMQLNRHARRAMGKANKVKIPGTTAPYRKPKKEDQNSVVPVEFRLEPAAQGTAATSTPEGPGGDH